MDLNSSELPDDNKTIVNEDTVKKNYYEKIENIPANYVLEMRDLNDRDSTRFEVLYCSEN